MIERIFNFCFGSQWHKYGTLILATVIAATCTVPLVGLENATKSSPIIAVLAVLLAFPISWFLYQIEREVSDLTISRNIAFYASFRMGADDMLVADLEEYRTSVREQFGERRANNWYRIQALTALLHTTPIRRWQAALLLLIASKVYVDLSLHPPDIAIPVAFLPRIRHHVFDIAIIAIVLMALLHTDHDFERFRSERRSRHRPE